MSISAMIRRMGQAGATPEAIAIAVEEIEAVQFALEARRAGDRDRKRRQREAQKSADVTGHSGDSHGTVTDTPPPPDKSPPDPQKLTPTPAHSGTQTRARKAGSFPCPDGVDPGHWSDFLANRKTKRLTNTPTAYRNLLGQLTALADDEWPPGRIVEFAAARGWGAIFDPRNREQANGHQRHRQPVGRDQPADGLSATTRAALDVFGPSIAGAVRDRADQVPRLGGPGGHGGGRAP